MRGKRVLQFQFGGLSFRALTFLAQFENRAAISDEAAGGVEKSGADDIGKPLRLIERVVPFSTPVRGSKAILRHVLRMTDLAS